MNAMKTCVPVLAALLACVVAAARAQVDVDMPPLQRGPDEALVREFLAIREGWVKEQPTRIPGLAKTLRSALDAAHAGLNAGDYDEALAALKPLETYAPLINFPSFEVQLTMLAIYMKLRDTARIATHRARAEAMREVLLQRIGHGNSLGSPKKVLMPSEMYEWAQTLRARIMGVTDRIYQGRTIKEVTYIAPFTKNKPHIVYFEVDPRLLTIDGEGRGERR